MQKLGFLDFANLNPTWPSAVVCEQTKKLIF